MTTLINALRAPFKGSDEIQPELAARLDRLVEERARPVRDDKRLFGAA